MKSLRQRLQQFENLGLVNRKQYDEKPLRVEYSLTDKGRRFNDLLDLAKEIADEWQGTVCRCPLDKECGPEDYCCPKRREAMTRQLAKRAAV